MPINMSQPHTLSEEGEAIRLRRQTCIEAANAKAIALGLTIGELGEVWDAEGEPDTPPTLVLEYFAEPSLTSAQVIDANYQLYQVANSSDLAVHVRRKNPT